MYDAFLQEAAATQIAALRPGTRMAHKRAVKLFIAFSVRYQRSYFQPQVAHILAFIQYLTTAMTSPASIRNTISSLSSAYKRLGWDPTPFTGHFVQAALKSIDVNSRYEPIQKEAIAPDQLDSILAMVLAATGDYSLVCLLSFGFSGFFRQSNMALSSAKVFDPTRQFTRADVSPGVQGLTVKVKWTKTLQRYQEATSVFLPAISGRHLCPVLTFRNMVIRVPTTAPTQPLFCHPGGEPLTLPYVTRQWKRALTTLGLDQAKFSLHSLRRGGASAVWATGLVSPTDIMRHGTWASDSWRAYSHRPPPASTVVLGLSSLSK